MDFDLDLDLDLDFDDRGGAIGTVADREALKIEPPFGDRCKEIVWLRELLKVASEVKVELPLGKRIRSS